jgi:hypothetical protein
MTIVVGGYIIGYPLGGMTWHHLHYLLGLHELGHEVWFLEDSGEFSMPYNPTTWRVDPDPTYGIDYLNRTFAAYNLPQRWCYYSQFWDTYYGLRKDELNDLLKRADLMLCVSGVTPIRADRPRPKRLAVIDTDPVFTQLRMRDDEVFCGYFRQFDKVATFGTEIGKSHGSTELAEACPLPTHGIDWIPTNQPIVMRHWPVVAPRTNAFTTIGKWEHSSDRHIEFNGRHYQSSKGVEWMKVLDLPKRVPSWDMTIGMQAMPADVKRQFESHGWRWIDPEPASISCQAFGDFVRDSAGEFTVTKEIYSGLPSGWFSDRSSAYLASGRPVITQSSGFEHWLPTGEGLFAFTDIDSAANALAAIASDYERHSRAAREIAKKHMDAGVVLPKLLDRLM